MTNWRPLSWLLLFAAILVTISCTTRGEAKTATLIETSRAELTATPVPSPIPQPSPTRLAAATPPPRPSPVPSPTRTATPTPTVAPQVLAARLGFVVPIRGAHVPEWLDLVPGAARDYRGGLHEGVDFGYNAVGVTVYVGTGVIAAGDGVVVRADADYREPTVREMTDILARANKLGNADGESLDKLRGRQVWIDHGNGIVTRYAHLDRVAPGVSPGAPVAKGQTIAYVGLSGIPGEGAGEEPHLHFEIRVGGGYLGQGLSRTQARQLYVQALSGKN